MGPEQTLQPLSLFIKFINFLLAFKHTFWELKYQTRDFCVSLILIKVYFTLLFAIQSDIDQNRLEQREV